MSNFDLDEPNGHSYAEVMKTEVSPEDYVDSGSVSPDERPFYRPDEYYTFYPYNNKLFTRVVEFEKRKQISYPSARGLYVAEILLLEYCSHGKYPKPKAGYPGFWWFEYGLRDIGHALESLEKRGFIRWASKKGCLHGLNVAVLKQILANAGLPENGRKNELIERIVSDIPEEQIVIPDYVPKYELTDTGKKELEENGYIPYIHKNNKSILINIWEINKLFPDGNATNWRKVVGEMEEDRLGINMADAAPVPDNENGVPVTGEDIRRHLADMQETIKKGIRTKGDGYNEEAKGLELKAAGRDREALVYLFISIGKRFAAPALYKETAVILRRYGLYKEELSVIDTGIEVLTTAGLYNGEMISRREKLLELIIKKARVPLRWS